jgi:hypothetical protein
LHFLTGRAALSFFFPCHIGLLFARIWHWWLERLDGVHTLRLLFSTFVFDGGGPGDSGIFRRFGAIGASVPDFADH